MAAITKKVADLQVGDNLGNCVILERPAPIAFRGPLKDKMAVKVRFLDGTESLRSWGKHTTVTLQ